MFEHHKAHLLPASDDAAVYLCIETVVSTFSVVLLSHSVLGQVAV